jgi:hypothetical protein
MGKVDISKLAARLAELNKSGGGEGLGVTFLSIKDGRNVIRILPPGEGKDMFAEEVWVHYGVGKTAENKNGTMVVCPRTKNENAPCPVCELSAELKKLSKKKDDNYDKQAKSIYRKKRVYYNAIDREEDLSSYSYNEDEKKWYKGNDEEAPIKVLGTGIGIYKDIMAFFVDPEYGDVTDFEEGLDLIITKTGSGQYNTNYDVKTVRKESPAIPDDAPKELVENWESYLSDFSTLTEPKSYDDLVSLMGGGSPSEDEEDNSTEADEESTSQDTASEHSEETDDDGLADELAQAIARRRNKRK